MTRALFAIPGNIATRTGGYGYARRVLADLPACGVELTHLALPEGFPAPGPMALYDSLALLSRAGPESVLLVDGLAFGALPANELARLRARLVALVHHPLSFETGLSPDESHRLFVLERAALAQAHAVIVPSASTRDALVAEFEVPPDRVTIAEPGTDPVPRAAGSGGPLVPRKGFDVLVAALAGLRHLSWRLVIVGSPSRDPACARALFEEVAAKGLGDRIAFAGEASEAALAQAYACADLFVLPSFYEGYGMVLAEAMACGLPVVTTTAGAAAMTVPDAAALRVAPGNAPALAAALAVVLGEPSRRASLAEASWQAGARLPRWTDTAALVAGVLHRVSKAGS